MGREGRDTGPDTLVALRVCPNDYLTVVAYFLFA